MRSWGAIALAGLAVAGCGGGGHRGEEPLVVYHREYGGIVGGTADLTVRPDGTASVTQGFGTNLCGPRISHVPAGQVTRLRRLLARARTQRPRRRVVHFSESPGVRIRSGGVRLEFVGVLIPRKVFPATVLLDRLITARRPPGCRAIP